MYGMFSFYLYHKNYPLIHVGKYTSPMDAIGFVWNCWNYEQLPWKTVSLGYFGHVCCVCCVHVCISLFVRSKILQEIVIANIIKAHRSGKKHPQIDGIMSKSCHGFHRASFLFELVARLVTKCKQNTMKKEVNYDPKCQLQKDKCGTCSNHCHLENMFKRNFAKPAFLFSRFLINWNTHMK